MKVGIVGLPNAGKSSLFNALTRAGAEAANYPFTTIEPNVAVVPVTDERLDVHVMSVDKELRCFFLFGLCPGCENEKKDSHQKRFARPHARPPKTQRIVNPLKNTSSLY